MVASQFLLSVVNLINEVIESILLVNKAKSLWTFHLPQQYTYI